MTSLYFYLPDGGLSELSPVIDEVQQGARKWMWGPREWNIWEVLWRQATHLCQRYGIDECKRVHLHVTARSEERTHKGGTATSVCLDEGVVEISRGYGIWDGCWCAVVVPEHLRAELREAGLLEPHPDARSILIGSAR